MNREANRQTFAIIQKALSDKAGQVSFEYCENQIIQSSHVSQTGNHTVACIRGDSLGILSAIVKVDVEGHELSVVSRVKVLPVRVSAVCCRSSSRSTGGRYFLRT